MRVNVKIRAREVFVIGEDGEQLGVMSPEEAMQLAQDEDLDLVEVNPNAKPPVCRIMDYGKFLYDKKKQQKGGGARLDMKEIRVRPKTGAHDIEVKVTRGRRFLEKGHKVQLTMLLRGRERAHPDRAEQVLLGVAEMLTDIAKVELHPRLTHNRMSMLFAPDKAAIARLVAARPKEVPAHKKGKKSKRRKKAKRDSQVSDVSDVSDASDVSDVSDVENVTEGGETASEPVAEAVEPAPEAPESTDAPDEAPEPTEQTVEATEE